MQEIYKDIQGYEGLYQVSNLGNVISLPKGDGNGNRTRLLKFDKSKRGATTYHRVTLSKDGKTKRFQVHRLVATAFIPNPDNKPFVNHIDNNGENNCVINLEWCTHVENMEHSSKQGRQDTTRSLGGIIMQQRRKERLLQAYNSLVGTRFGSLIVTGFYLDISLNSPRIKFDCICDCGNTTSKSQHKLETGSQQCADCSYKSRGETRKRNAKMKI